MKVVRKKDVFTAVRIEEKGKLFTLTREIDVKPGDVKITDWQGNEDVLDEQLYQRDFLQVQEEKKTTLIGKDFSDEDWANVYSEMEEVYKAFDDSSNDYISSDLISNKAF